MPFPEQGARSGFDVIDCFTMLQPEIRLRSSLSSLHDAVKPRLFNHDVHHPGHCAGAAHGSLKPPPTRRLRRAILHLSHSMTLARLPDTVTYQRGHMGLGAGAEIPIGNFRNDRMTLLAPRPQAVARTQQEGKAEDREPRIRPNK